MKHLFTFLTIGMIGILCLQPSVAEAQNSNTINSQVTKQKEVDNGGSGMYRAIVVSEKAIPHLTVYRPRNIKYAARREGPLPILIWFNGACSGSNTGYERMLNEIASHGYVVIGAGAFRMQDSDGGDDGSDWTQASEAIDWLVKQERLKSSDYYKAVDLKNIALAGHSCGGAQAIANCANSRVKTLMIMNSGMGTGVSMGGASPQTLNSLHCPLIYISGGPDDVAYENAKTDYERVKVKVVWADLPVGHGGTYGDRQGGEYGRLAVRWMDWQLKGMKQNARTFLKPDLKGFSANWKISARNFKTVDMAYDEPFEEIETVADTMFDRAALQDSFDFGADVSMLTTETGKGRLFYNSSGQKKAVIPVLKEKGINSIRVRVLVNPTGDNYNLVYAKNIANTARTQQLNVMLDLHYCDWWGDNVTPVAWASYDFDKLITTMRSHTLATVRSMNLTRMLKWVQIGNEVDNGFLWNTGLNTANFVQFINTAHEAVKEVNPEVQTVIHVSECANAQWLTNYFDTLQVNGAQFDAIGLSVHVKGTTTTPARLAEKVVENVKMLKERYGKPVLIVETGYYNDRQLEGNQWMADFLTKLIEAGAAGLYYWEPELSEDYHLGAWNPLTRRPSMVLDAFQGLRHREGTDDAIHELENAFNLTDSSVQTEYYTPNGIRIEEPQRGINIVRVKKGSVTRTYKIYK